MTCRVVTGLAWAKQLHGRPATIPVGRPRGVKAKGVRYENAVAKMLPEARHGVWWEFNDLNGHGYCQTDLALPIQGLGILVLECKLTWVPEAHKQLDLLYKPVVELATGKPVFRAAVARNLVQGMPEALHIAHSLKETLEFALNSQPVVLHWIGFGAL